MAGAGRAVLTAWQATVLYLVRVYIPRGTRDTAGLYVPCYGRSLAEVVESGCGEEELGDFGAFYSTKGRDWVSTPPASTTVRTGG